MQVISATRTKAFHLAKVLLGFLGVCVAVCRSFKDPSAQFSSVDQLCLFAIPWTATHQAIPIHHQLLELTQTYVH